MAAADRDAGEAAALTDRLLQRAEALQPLLAERAAAARSQRRLPAETLRDFAGAGFFRILQPRRWGGYALDPRAFYAVQRRIGAACMSSAWVLGVLGVHNWQLGLFDDRAAADVWAGDDAVLLSSAYAPVGRVQRVEGGFQLSGRWSFSSGCEHCDWALLGAVVPQPGAPFDMRHYRTFLVPRRDYRIIDTWNVVGLQATGSHDIEVEGAFVPEHRTHRLLDGYHCDNPGNAVNTDPLFRLPFGQVFVRAVSSASLGALQGSLDAFVAGLADGARSSAGRDDPATRQLVAEVQADLEEMQATLQCSFGRMLAQVAAGEPIPLAERARYRFDSARVADRCAALSARLLKASGSAGIFLDHPVLMRHLDLLAAQAHIANNGTLYGRNLGAQLLGEANTEWSI